LAPVKGDRLFAYKSDLFYIHTSKKQCKFPPVINIHASAWVEKEKKEAKLLNITKKKTKQHTSYLEKKAREIIQ